VRLVPVAVLGASSKLVATHGLATFGSLSHYVALCLFGMLMHFLLIYSSWVVFYIKISLQQFWRAVFEPALYAFSVNSSLVALPLTLAALDKLGVSRRAATLAACVGTNLNNDGIILYEGFTLLALAQASGVDMSISLQIFAALYCIVAAMGVAGVPEAGVVALTLVLSGLGLGTESLAVLLSVDWILARARSWLNTSSDMVSSLILDRMIKKT
jgi:DAACS family dicarboxylate/amino acid:cation (Na+ or H+) symporter